MSAVIGTGGGASRKRWMPSVAAQRGLLGAILLLALWEGVARGFDLPAYTLPTVSSILARVAAQRQALAGAAVVTLFEAVAGYLLGASIGIALAVLVVLQPGTRRVVLPVATAFNSVPVIAWSPLILLWFGMGMSSKVVMVALAISFTLFLSALAGMDRVDRKVVDLMRSFGAGGGSIFWRIRVPAALPLTFAGLRVATARSVLIAVVTEMLGANAGLGQLIYQAVVQIDFVQVWSAVLVASAASLFFFGLVSYAERRLIFWN
jgi:NitT/TauT family transport system permease protein